MRPSAFTDGNIPDITVIPDAYASMRPSAFTDGNYNQILSSRFNEAVGFPPTETSAQQNLDEAQTRVKILLQ